ncbi:hypothetical protein TRFO_27188 [Tritrichomonas foetus]|uniref:Cyclic nucleotide-binding domain-containing protein n=1 Tax=Tritrichomonas foetus TaxID=1144522 RepID=A0A1J4K2Y3_9EUKA|nr:hypothetical protein TRFO_27188 [Tritrichomonas foetus]|eukprot:OHT05176.1 hypothetical protein TRFO_27188 [Tritrichomonas foetus]
MFHEKSIPKVKCWSTFKIMENTLVKISKGIFTIMKTRKTKRQTLVVSKAFHSPPPGPPLIEEVIDALYTPPSNRTRSKRQTIFRYLLFNKDINYMYQTSQLIEEISKDVQITILKKNEALFFEGDNPDGWYLVVTGKVDIIIRFFLVAEDCLFEHDVHETQEFIPLMNLMNLDVTIDKLKRVNVIESGQTFGQHSYLLDKRRSATVVGSEFETILMKMPENTLKNTHTLIRLKSLISENREIIHKAFPRLRDDQLFQINGFAKVLDLPVGRKITQKSQLSHSIYIVKKGSLKRMRVVDFTKYSFRKIDAHFEPLELHFPDGFHPVHVDDLHEGSFFADPSVSELADSHYNMTTTSATTLIAIDFDYFKVIAGSFEVERVRKDLKSKISDEDVIRIWVEAEKKRLWNNFKERNLKEAHRELKTSRRAHTSTVAIRLPSQPKSIKEYHPKKRMYYVSPSLR